MTTTTSGSATDLITFSRGSLATVTDSNGYIKWSPHNLLLASEQFDASAWSKLTNSTALVVTANDVAAPNGTTTGDRLPLNAVAASTDYSLIRSTITASAASYTLGIWVKAVAAGDVGKSVWLYGLQGVTQLGLVSATLTSSWQLLTTTITATAASLAFNVGAIGSFYGGFNQAAVSVHLWGAHLYRSDLGGMQANASAYPYYNPSTPKNLLGYSNLTAGWLTQFSATITANATTGPDGFPGAAQIDLSSSISSAAYQSTSFVGSATFSVWLKGQSGGETVVLAAYNATDGLLQSSVFTLTTSWVRYSWSVVTTASTTYYILNSGALAKTLYAWGAQLSDSASLDPYVGSYGAAPSAAAAYGPRLDYDPSTLAAKGLLVEEQRTNLLTYSDQFNNAAWTKTNSSVTANAVASPDGTASADKLSDFDGTLAAHLLYQNVASSGTTYTLSVYAKEADYSYIQLHAFGTDGVVFNLSTGVVVSGTGGSITTAGNGWYRCSFTFAATGPSVFISQNKTSTSGYLYSGTTGSGIYLYGAQIEAGSFATSYIPTAAATVTRNADVAFVATSQFPYSATEGSIVANASTLAGALGVNNTLYTLGSDANNYFWNWVWSGASTLPRVTVFSAGASQADLTSSSVTANTPFKTATGYKVNDFAYTVNAATVATDTSGSLPAAATRFSLGSREDATFYFNGHIRQITYIPRRLTDAELQARTA